MGALYKGFSTQNFVQSNGQTLFARDIDLVKQDLIRHIYTAPGERVSMPNWGTRIPFMVFEQNDEKTRRIIEEDLRMVIDHDPRVNLINMKVVSVKDLNMIVAFIDVEYVEFNVTETLNLQFKVSV
jgi:phage baseplate assembly protein W